MNTHMSGWSMESTHCKRWARGDMISGRLPRFVLACQNGGHGRAKWGRRNTYSQFPQIRGRSSLRRSQRRQRHIVISIKHHYFLVYEYTHVVAFTKMCTNVNVRRCIHTEVKTGSVYFYILSLFTSWIIARWLPNIILLKHSKPFVCIHEKLLPPNGVLLRLEWISACSYSYSKPWTTVKLLLLLHNYLITGLSSMLDLITEGSFQDFSTEAAEWYRCFFLLLFWWKL